MVYHVLMAVVGVVVLAGAWVAVQSLVRRGSPELAEDADVLTCHVCGADGTCHCGLRNAEPTHPKSSSKGRVS